MRGGYKIINFKGKALTSGTPARMEGIYEQAKNRYGKATMVSGLVVSNVKYPDFFAIFDDLNPGEVAKVVVNTTTLIISITANDMVTVTATEAARASKTSK